jgi:hypothetical protein
MILTLGKVLLTIALMIAAFFLIPKPSERISKWFARAVWLYFLAVGILAVRRHHWIRAAGCLAMWAGATLNWFAVWRAGGKMPVWRSRRNFRGSATHYNSPTFVFLGDWIDVRFGIASPGDVLLAVGFFVNMLS